MAYVLCYIVCACPGRVKLLRFPLMTAGALRTSQQGLPIDDSTADAVGWFVVDRPG